MYPGRASQPLLSCHRSGDYRGISILAGEGVRANDTEQAVHRF